jgi:hypothetical protein
MLINESTLRKIVRRELLREGWPFNQGSAREQAAEEFLESSPGLGFTASSPNNIKLGGAWATNFLGGNSPTDAIKQLFLCVDNRNAQDIINFILKILLYYKMQLYPKNKLKDVDIDTIKRDYGADLNDALGKAINSGLPAAAEPSWFKPNNVDPASAAAPPAAPAAAPGAAATPAAPASGPPSKTQITIEESFLHEDTAAFADRRQAASKRQRGRALTAQGRAVKQQKLGHDVREKFWQNRSNNLNQKADANQAAYNVVSPSPQTAAPTPAAAPAPAAPAPAVPTAATAGAGAPAAPAVAASTEKKPAAADLRALQKVLGAEIDGVWGPATAQAWSTWVDNNINPAAAGLLKNNWKVASQKIKVNKLPAPYPATWGGMLKFVNYVNGMNAAPAQAAQAQAGAAPATTPTAPAQTSTSAAPATMPPSEPWWSLPPRVMGPVEMKPLPLGKGSQYSWTGGHISDQVAPQEYGGFDTAWDAYAGGRALAAEEDLDSKTSSYDDQDEYQSFNNESVVRKILQHQRKSKKSE